MADIIHNDYRVISILSRFNIPFGFGKQTILEVCTKQGVNADFFLEIIKSVNNPEYFPDKQLQNFSSPMIIKYLSSTHSFYLEQKVPEIQNYIDDLEAKASKKNASNIHLLNVFFKEYREELAIHLAKEEDHVFPYVLKLEQALEKDTISDNLLNQIHHEPIQNYERNHDQLDSKLSDLKNLIIMYLPPVLCRELCQKLLIELFRLEEDIVNHTKIEEKVLIPKVKMLEQKIWIKGRESR